MRKISTYLVLSVLIFMPLLLSGASSVRAATGDTFIVAESNNPLTFDPAQCYDSVSQDYMIQFEEGLFMANTSSPDMEPIPRLATALGVWSDGNLNYTVTLREDVVFSDGAAFNAEAVKWNMDRTLFLFQNEACDPEILWKVGEDFILNRTTVVSEFVVKFTLNFVAKMWVKILSTCTCWMISPELAAGYEESLLELGDIDLIAGTGAWVLDSFTLSQRCVFSANPDYYRPQPSIKKMVFQIIKDDSEASLALLDHTVHFGGVIPAYWGDVDADPLLDVEIVPTTLGYYLTFNVNNMPRDARYAIANCINYSYVIEVIRLNRAVELHTPIFHGILYNNDTIDGLPSYDVTLARQTLCDSVDVDVVAALAAANLDITNTSEEWVAAAEGSNPVFTFNFSRYISSGVDKIVTLVTDNCKQIGIKIENEVIGYFDAWVEFSSDRANDKFLEIAFGGCAPDYFEPVNIADQIFRTNAPLNTMGLADATLDGMLDTAYLLTMVQHENNYSGISKKESLLPLLLVLCYINQSPVLHGIIEYYQIVMLYSTQYYSWISMIVYLLQSALIFQGSISLL